jgi:hypothetical protein
MEQVIIQECGCIALPEDVASALDFRRGMILDVALNSALGAIVLTPHHNQTTADDTRSQTTPASNCVVLPPSR